ncbi:MAG: lipoate--protein ligase family protein [Candidatus Lokiarchaeota archaeon]|nr:lipoate--protein ligase family protein [Candidatus Lokiarchaeota archaeon]
MNEWRLLPIEIYNGYWNMALDEAILTLIIENKSPNTLRFYKWNPSTISIGQNQSLSSEVDTAIAQNKGFNVVRRITGGGAVFHDRNREITYSITCPIKFLENLNAYKVIEQFEIIEMGIISGLKNYGLESEPGIIHCPALFVEGKKFSGNAQVRKKGHILQHGTILLELDADLMYSVLKAPHNVSKSRMVKSVYAKCIGIKELLPQWNEDKFLSSLKQGFENILKIKLKEGQITSEEFKLAEKLMKEKYSNQKWLNKYD